MTVFLFIPSPRDSRVGQRVNFANIASLFAEVEEPPAVRAANGGAVGRVLMMVLITILAIGDTVLVAHPDALASYISARQIAGAPVRAASL